MKTNDATLIVTAASAAYGPALLALLGSLNLNWPDHPPVRIYDIGLDKETVSRLQAEGFAVHPVPAFCPHWRRHFTWKVWCFNDVKTDCFLWMDAAFVVMEPLWEIFTIIEQIGYFAVPNYQLLDWEASPQSCEGCGLPPDFKTGKRTFAGGLIGFHKTSKNVDLLKEALAVAMHEPYIKATEAAHRHDQAILSLLLYKYYAAPVFSDGLIFLGWKSPRQVPGQKVWAHRRRLSAEDKVYLAAHISTPGPSFFPREPVDRDRRESMVRRIIRGASGRLVRGKGPRIMEPYDGVRET